MVADRICFLRQIVPNRQDFSCSDMFRLLYMQNAGVGLLYPVHVYSILFLKLFVSQSLVYLYAIVRVLRA
jgi:hypothetical protein